MRASEGNPMPMIGADVHEITTQSGYGTSTRSNSFVTALFLHRHSHNNVVSVTFKHHGVPSNVVPHLPPCINKRMGPIPVLLHVF